MFAETLTRAALAAISDTPHSRFRGGPGRRGLYTYHFANHGNGSRPVSGGGTREREHRLRRAAKRA